MEETDISTQTNNNSSKTMAIDSDDQEIAEYGDDMFIKLKDRDISVTANIKFNSSTATDKTSAQETGIAKPRSINLSFIDILDKVCFQNILKALEINAPKYTYIQDLNLSNNNIRSEYVKNIISFLENNNRIEKLNLSGNFLNNEIALSALMKTIGDLNESLQVLSLAWNGISGEICTNIIRNLMVRSKSLRILDLSWNNFSDVGKILGQGINQTTRLQNLDLSNNPFTDEDIVDILNGIVNPTSLRSLGIKHVFVNEQIEKAILKAQSRVPDCNVNVAVYTGIKTDPEVDLKSLYLERIHFLGVTKPKKKNQKIDIGHVLLKMKIETNLEPMKLSLFLSTFENLKNVAIIELLGDLANQFRNADKAVDVALMLDKYLELYPDTTLE